MLFLCGGCRDIVTSIGLSRLPHDHLPRETHEEKIREGGNRVAGAVGGARRVTHAVSVRHAVRVCRGKACFFKRFHHALKGSPSVVMIHSRPHCLSERPFQ